MLMTPKYPSQLQLEHAAEILGEITYAVIFAIFAGAWFLGVWLIVFSYLF